MSQIVDRAPQRNNFFRLLGDSVSLERAWHELNNPKGRAPASTLEALIFSLRRGVTELTKPDRQRRLAALEENQLEAACLRLQAFQPKIAEPWSPDDVDLLISAWRKFREQR
jgi:hypothetical protein